MNDQELNAIEQRANAATPGPWGMNFANEQASNAAFIEGGRYVYPLEIASLYECDRDSEQLANAHLIAAAREDIPALVAEVRRLREAQYELYEALKALLSIVDESDGVSGYHLNGDIATWGEFDAVDSARAAIRKAEEGAEG